MIVRALLSRLQSAIRAVLASFARFEHRGAVVTYAGVVLDQTAIVAAIDTAAAGVRGVDADSVLPRIRIAINADAAPGAMVAVWTHGRWPLGRITVSAGPGCTEAIRAGVDALVRSHFDPTWRPSSAEGPVS